MGPSAQWPHQVNAQQLQAPILFSTKSGSAIAADFVGMIDANGARIRDKRDNLLAQVLNNNVSGGSMQVVLSGKDNHDLEAKDWSPWPTPRVTTKFGAPWVVAMAAHSTRFGPAMVPFTGIAQMIASTSGRVIVGMYKVHSLLLAKNDATVADFMTVLSDEELPDVWKDSSFAVLVPGQFVYVPCGYQVSLSTIDPKGACTFHVPLFSKDSGGYGSRRPQAAKGPWPGPPGEGGKGADSIADDDDDGDDRR